MSSSNTIVFHRDIRERLTRQFLANHIAQSYLFAGPKGVGKYTLAQWCAQLIICESNDAQPPCGSCTACRAAKANFHSDITVEAKDRTQSTISIEELRRIRERLSRTPLYAGWSVTILPDSERLSRAAQHAFLKTLEEPRSKSVLILTASSPSALLPTLLSRLTVIRMKLVPSSCMRRALKEIDPAAIAGEIDRLVEFSHGLPGRVIAEGLIDDRIQARLSLLARIMSFRGKPFWEVQKALREVMSTKNVYEFVKECLREMILLKSRQTKHDDGHEIHFLIMLYRSLSHTVNQDLAIDALCLSLARI